MEFNSVCPLTTLFTMGRRAKHLTVEQQRSAARSHTRTYLATPQSVSIVEKYTHFILTVYKTVVERSELPPGMLHTGENMVAKDHLPCHQHWSHWYHRHQSQTYLKQLYQD